jgi:3-dehydroquinate dehydratase-2
MTETTLGVWILHGPNLNLIGTREPHIYGATTLAEIDDQLRTRGAAIGAEVACKQSNHEGVLLDWIHEAIEAGVDAIVINAGALTHTSIALRDALAAYPGVKIECHLSNVWKREPFRHHSTISEVVDGVIAGLGPDGYLLALQGAVKLARRRAGGTTK